MATRRTMLKQSLFTAASGFFVPMINKNWFRLFPLSNDTYSARAVKLVTESMVTDMLNQFKELFKKPDEQLQQWLLKPGTFTEENYKHYHDSGINVFALGRDALNHEDALLFFAKWNGFIAGYNKWLQRIDSVESLANISNSKKTGILLSFQNSNHFRTPDDVDTFFGLGQRVSQLTYSESNLICDGFFEAFDGGLTDYGISIVNRMNKVGMAIDVSHSGDQTTFDAIELSKQPVIFSHAACRALVPKSLRNKKDDMIRKTAAKGGVMGIPFLRFMIKGDEPVTIESLLDHFDHVVKLVGPEFVAIGSDFAIDTDDAYLQESKQLAAKIKTADTRNRYGIHLSDKGLIGIEGVNHSKRVFDLTEGLIRRKYSDDNIRLILGGNFKRALSVIWSV